jgi:uncharacterized membrane protein
LPWHGVCNSAMAGKGTNYLVHAIFPAQKTWMHGPVKEPLITLSIATDCFFFSC